MPCKWQLRSAIRTSESNCNNIKQLLSQIVASNSRKRKSHQIEIWSFCCCVKVAEKLWDIRERDTTTFVAYFDRQVIIPFYNDNFDRRNIANVGMMLADSTERVFQELYEIIWAYPTITIGISTINCWEQAIHTKSKRILNNNT